MLTREWVDGGCGGDKICGRLNGSGDAFWGSACMQILCACAFVRVCIPWPVLRKQANVVADSMAVFLIDIRIRSCDWLQLSAVDSALTALRNDACGRLQAKLCVVGVKSAA